MDRQDRDFQEAMITLTGYPEWKVMVKDLESLIYHTQSNALEARSWEKLNEDKGFARGLQFVVGLRDRIKSTQQVEKANANL